MILDDKYFISFTFTKMQVKRNFENALKDLNIAKADKFLDVNFNYAYSALLKAGLALLSYQNKKVKSTPGHHIKIIEALAESLKDSTIEDLGEVMRSKRNIGMYSGGVEVTEKECQEYIDFVSKVISKVKAAINF